MLEVEQMFGCLDFVSCWSKKEEGGRTNQNLSFWGSSGQSEAQLLGTIGATLTGFLTKPPIMPFFLNSVLFYSLFKDCFACKDQTAPYTTDFLLSLVTREGRDSGHSIELLSRSFTLITSAREKRERRVCLPSFPPS